MRRYLPVAGVVAWAIILATVVLLLSGCASLGLSDSSRDYEEGVVLNPDSVTIWNNADGFPNLARMCVEGKAFLFTTRKGPDAMERFPDWDDECITDGLR